MIEIAMGGLRPRFLQDKSETEGSLTAFEMTVQPNARMPVAHYHESWDETVYGLSGTTIWRIEGKDHPVGAAESLFIRRGRVHGFRNDGGERPSASAFLHPAFLARITSPRRPTSRPQRARIRRA